MTILENRKYKRLGAAAVGFAGLLLTSVAVAGHGEGGNDGGWNDDKDDDDKDDDDKDDDDKDDDDHKGGGKHKQPRFEDEGDSLKAEVEVRVEKKKRIRAELEATAEVEIECRRKHGGGKKKKFEKELEIELEGVEFIGKDEFHGNRVEIEVETEDAEDALDDKYGDDGGCPDGWDRRIKEVSFLDAKLEIEEGKKELVTWLCTFDEPTDDGRVPREDVDCHRL